MIRVFMRCFQWDGRFALYETQSKHWSEVIRVEEVQCGETDASNGPRSL